MLDGAVTFDVERYAEVPDRLARVAHDLEAAADLLVRSGDPVGAATAAAVDSLAGWVRRERWRAAERWERILAIPGFERFRDWDGGRGAWTWDVDWVTGTDGDLHSYEELVALATYRESLVELLGRIEREEPIGVAEVDAALAAVAAIDGPEAAAALLDVLGADGFRRLQAALAVTTDRSDRASLERFEAGMTMLTARFATATHATGRAALSEAFLDDFLGPPSSATDAVPVVPGSAVDQVLSALTFLDLGREVYERLSRVVTGTAGLELPGVVFAGANALLPLVALLREGPLSSEFAGTSVGSALGLASFLAETAPVTLAFFLASGFVALILNSGEGEPPGLVLSPDAANPGGSHYPYYVDEAGVPH